MDDGNFGTQKTYGDIRNDCGSREMQWIYGSKDNIYIKMLFHYAFA